MADVEKNKLKKGRNMPKLVLAPEAMAGQNYFLASSSTNSYFRRKESLKGQFRFIFQVSNIADKRVSNTL
jgi:hypothetical protein